jgi:hypothetical protein
MRADELEKIIEETYSDHWEVISGGPTFLHSYRVSGSGGDAGISAAEYHDAIAVLRGDVDVRIAWGYNPDFGEWDRQFFPDGTFADPTVSTMLGDVFYRGALVQRYWLISVDGHRATLPSPRSRLKAGAPPMSLNPDDYEQVAVQRAVNFARLVDDLQDHNEFSEYLRRSGIVTIP